MNALHKIGRYETIRLLGRGGMGSVYLAQDPLIDRQVAIKVLDAALEPSARDRFSREARAAGRLHHPNIVTIFDVGEHDGHPFIAMEFVPGDTLAVLIQRRTLSLAERLRLVADACAALAYAHRAGIVHLDVKPENLIRHENGVLKVLDFGIARVLTTDATHTQHVVGTLRYMAPEQFSGGALDRRTDVYALGCVLYEVIALEPAFKGTLQDVLSRVMSPMQPLPLADVVPGVHPELVRITQRATAVDPADRYHDLEAVRRELEALIPALEGVPETLPVPRPAASSEARTMPSGVRPRPRAATVAGALGLTVSAALVMWQFALNRGTGTPPPPPAATAASAAPAPPGPRPSAATGPDAEPGPGPEAARTPVTAPAAEDSRAGDQADLEKQVWRLVAERDRQGALALLRRQRTNATPQFMSDLVAAARRSAADARAAADRRGVGASPGYQSGVEQLDRATALLARGDRVDGVAAFWRAADLFMAAAPRPEPPAPEPTPTTRSVEESTTPTPQPAAATAGTPPSTTAPAASTGREPRVGGAPAPAPPAPVSAPSAEDGIRAALRAYEAAYDNRDAAALRRIAPALSAAQIEAVSRTFADAVSYDVDMTVLKIQVSGSAATASCLIGHAIVPRIGSATRTAPAEMRFHLRQTSAGWTIERIER